MSTSNPTGRFRPGDRYWDRDNVDLRRERYAGQIAMMREALTKRGLEVAVYPDGAADADVEYMYRTDTILTRAADRHDICRVLGVPELADEVPADLSKPTRGLKVLRHPDASADEMVDRVSRMLGEGAATRDHVVHLSAASGCPATEPVKPSVAALDPPVNPRADAGNTIKVVVVDTGILPDVISHHTFLTGVTGDEEGSPDDVGHYRGHGTFIAGVVRAMAPAAEVYVVGGGTLFNGGVVFESELAPRLVDAFLLGPHIISLSAGTTTPMPNTLLSLETFYTNYLKDSGTVLVAAAGNDGYAGRFEPASLNWPIAVGALDKDGPIAGYSNYGTWVDVYARGSDIVNAYPNGPYTYKEEPMLGQPDVDFTDWLASWSGTSFATPLVAGLIAARMSFTGERPWDAWLALRAKAVARAPQLGVPVFEPYDGNP